MSRKSSSRELDFVGQTPGAVLKILREGVLIGLIALCAYLALALFSYSANDPGWSKTGAGGPIENSGGPAGAWLADVFFLGFWPVGLSFSTHAGLSGLAAAA